MPTSTQKRTYAPEFKLAAVARARTGDESITEIATDLGVAASTLRTWVRHVKPVAVVAVSAVAVPEVEVAPVPDAVAPPTMLRALFWGVGWRLPNEYGAWARQQIEGPQFRRAGLIRLWSYFALGLVVRIVVGELVLFHPNYSAEAFIFPLALLAGLSTMYLMPARAARARHMALVGQGLEAQTGKRASWLAQAPNGVRLLLPVVVIAAVVVLNYSNAQSSHAAVCPPAATDHVALPADLAEAMVSPAGFVQRPDAGTGRGALAVADLTSSAKHPADAAKVLNCNGFMDGYGRIWGASSGTPRGMYTRVYEFATETGASNYARLDTAATLKSKGTSKVALPALPDGALITSSEPDAAHFNYAMAIGSSGRFVYVVRQFSSGEVTLAEIEDLAQAQSTALRGL